MKSELIEKINQIDKSWQVLLKNHKYEFQLHCHKTPQTSLGRKGQYKHSYEGH
jgi:hypothetical protein